MFGLGPLEMVIILAAALVFIGPGKLPEVARSLGKGMREMRRAVAGFEGGIPAGRAGLLALGAGAALLLDDGGRLQTFQGAFWHLSSAAALTTEQECGQQGL